MAVILTMAATMATRSRFHLVGAVAGVAAVGEVGGTEEEGAGMVAVDGTTDASV